MEGTMRRVGCLVAIAVGAIVGASSPVEAQAWLDDRDRAEGPGFRVGNLELHPGVGFEAGYDSNVFLQSQDERGSGVLRTTAHLLVSTLGPERLEEGEATEDAERDRQMIAFRGGINASYIHFTANRVRDDVAGGLGLDMTVNPTGPFTLRVHENFRRQVRPFAPDSGFTDRRIRWGRNRNVAGIDLGLRSRSGILQTSLGYAIEYEAFDDRTFRYANSLTHVARSNSSWRFLPSTAFIHEFELRVQRLTRWDTDAPSLLSDNIRLSTMAGLNGAITNTFSVAALVGYAAGFYENELVNDFDSPIARVEMRWNPRRTVETALGYDRRFVPSVIGNYRKSDRLYARAQFLMLGALMIGPEAAVSWDVTDTALASEAGELLGNQPRRESVRVRATLFAEYRVTDWLALNATAGYMADFTDFEFREPVDPSEGVLVDPLGNFQRFEVFGGIRAFY
jgi:hypothetical protein